MGTWAARCVARNGVARCALSLSASTLVFGGAALFVAAPALGETVTIIHKREVNVYGGSLMRELRYFGEPGRNDPGGRGGGGSAAPASNGSTDQGDEKDKEDEKKKPDCASEQNPSTGNPVIIATGEKVLPQIDFVAGSSYGLGLSRTYRSKATVSKFFGPNWASTSTFRRWPCPAATGRLAPIRSA